MDSDTFEFRAPQYWVDLCSELESVVEDSAHNFGSEFDKISLDFSKKSEEHKYSTINFSGTFMGLKSGERELSDKRSSVLCERLEDNHSYVVNQVFSSALDNVLNSPAKAGPSTPSRKQKIEPKPQKPGAYLFSVKSKLKTPRKTKNVLQEIIDNMGGDSSDLKETFSLNYSGLGTTQARNRFTVAKPFSFHERDEEFLRRKKEKLQKAKEKVVKIPVFQARPVPSFVLSNNISKLNLSQPSQNIKKGTPKEVKSKFPEDLKNAAKKE